MKRREFIGAAAIGALAASAAAQAQPPRRTYKRIATEEGFLIPEVLDENERIMRAGGPQLMTRGAGVMAQNSIDIGAGRIAKMDADGVDMQLLLLSSPGVQVYDRDKAVALAKLANDRVAAAVKAYPTRLAALTTIAPQDPIEAVKELERGVRTLGLNGVLVNSHTNNEYLDLPKFWPIFEAAEALDAPIYIHPRDPAAGMAQIMTGPVLGGPAFAYGVEVAVHALKLIDAGLFDRFPKLKIVIGHMGESIPFWLQRIDNRFLWSTRTAPSKLKRLPSEYFKANFWVTTSGMNYKAPLMMTIEQLGIDRVLYAIDYPFENQGEAVKFAEAMPLTPAQKMKFFQTNAQSLFKIKTI
jgi:5-carboxyvanillate decarboxylase